jgi:hypothetical protein
MRVRAPRARWPGGLARAGRRRAPGPTNRWHTHEARCTEPDAATAKGDGFHPAAGRGRTPWSCRGGTAHGARSRPPRASHDGKRAAPSPRRRRAPARSAARRSRRDARSAPSLDPAPPTGRACRRQMDAVPGPARMAGSTCAGARRGPLDTRRTGFRLGRAGCFSARLRPTCSDAPSLRSSAGFAPSSIADRITLRRNGRRAPPEAVA